MDKCKSVLINQLCSFTVDTKDNSQQGSVKVVVTSESNLLEIVFLSAKTNLVLLNKDPDGNHIQAKAINNQDSTWKIEFSPAEIGENSLTTKKPFVLFIKLSLI